jgi:DNA-binding transcriptional regulator/RsmH inhibitor MraZ
MFMAAEYYFCGKPEEYDLDHKLRVLLPHMHRKMLARIDENYKHQGMYVSKVDDLHVRCFSQTRYTALAERLCRKGYGNKDRKEFFEAAFSPISKKEHRITLPASFCGLEKVIFVANGDCLEISGKKSDKTP